MSEVDERREDGYSILWPVLAFVVGGLCEVLASAAKFGGSAELLFFFAPFIALVAALVWFVALLLNAYRERRKRVLSALAAVPAALLALPGLWSSLDLASDVRLMVDHADYDRQIAALPFLIGRRRMRWNWGGFGSAVTPGFTTWLVYDETAAAPSALCPSDPERPGDRPWCGRGHPEPASWRLWGFFYIVEEPND